MNPELNNINNTLAILQQVALDMASAVDYICDSKGLRYSLGFGSLLGAVRHQGFIPWDDDIDLLMPREDYDTFAEVAASELPDYYKLQHFKMGTSNRYVMRVVNMRVPIHLESYDSEFNDMHAWLDIFPLDGLPSSYFARRIHYWKVLWHKAMCAFATFDETVNRHRPGRPIIQQSIIDFCSVTHFGSWMNANERLQKYDAALKFYNFQASETCFCAVGPYDAEKMTWPRKVFDNLIKFPFEDRVFCGPADYDTVLATLYGDYMTPPPKEQRAVHQIEVVSCEPMYD